MNHLTGLYKLLGRLWLQEVDLKTLRAMGTDPFASTYQELGGFVPTELDDVQVEKLAIEYCELLIGPKGHVSPVQSVWADDQFQSGAASSMRRFFELVPDYIVPSGMPDHIGVQLDFASVIAGQTEPEKHEIASHFQREHLNWAFDFLARIESNARSEFYRGLATVTRGAISELSHA